MWHAFRDPFVEVHEFTFDALAILIVMPEPLPTSGKYGSIKVRVVVNQSPIEDSAVLTKPTAKALDHDLLNGKYYINLHAAAYPRGEIRGQIVKTMQGGSSTNDRSE